MPGTKQTNPEAFGPEDNQLEMSEALKLSTTYDRNVSALEPHARDLMNSYESSLTTLYARVAQQQEALRKATKPDTTATLLTEAAATVSTEIAQKMQQSLGNVLDKVAEHVRELKLLKQEAALALAQQPKDNPQAKALFDSLRTNIKAANELERTLSTFVFVMGSDHAASQKMATSLENNLGKIAQHAQELKQALVSLQDQRKRAKLEGAPQDPGQTPPTKRNRLG